MSNTNNSSVGPSDITDDTAKLDRELTPEEEDAIKDQVLDAVEEFGNVVVQQHAPPGTPKVKRQRR